MDKAQVDALRSRARLGVITALPKELAAVKAVLLEPVVWTAPGIGAGRRYVLGEVPAENGGRHVVVLALLVDMGNNSAGIRATQLLTHFPELRHVVMCGIAAGVPVFDDAAEHVRLGDVVVSDRNGVVQFDNVKRGPGGEIEHREPPRPPGAELLEAVRHLDAQVIEGKRPWEAFLCLAEGLEEGTRPGDDVDARGSAITHPKDPKRRPGMPRVFSGAVGSSNTLLKDAAYRDELRRHFRLRAVEMEGSGVADATWMSDRAGYLVVRGICDYADAGKGDRWQGAAAVAAAAYLRALLESMPAEEHEAPRQDEPPRLAVVAPPKEVAVTEPSPPRGRPPVPRYEDARIQQLAAELDGAEERRKALLQVGAGTSAVDQEILDLRRKLREGGRLRAGDALGNGRYRLLDQVGRGGFATVWSAFDRERGETVAVKVLHPELAKDPVRYARFFRGARVMARLEHDAVVRVLCEQEEDGGWFYFVMEFLGGGDLRHAVVKGTVTREQAMPLVLRVGEALAQAHAKGIVHRDVKPANVLLDAAGAPRLTDFDLVAVDETTGGTRTGAMGTWPYMAPEQRRDASHVDARADVYGLGATAVYCLCGDDNFDAPNDKVLDLKCNREIKDVLIRATSRAVETRFANAGEFCTALRKAMEAKHTEALPPTQSPVFVMPLQIPVSTFPNVAGPSLTQVSLFMKAVAFAYKPSQWPRWVGVVAGVSIVAVVVMGVMLVFRTIRPAGLATSTVGTTLATLPPSESAPSPMASTKATKTLIVKICPDEMVPVPGGTFAMGSPAGLVNERPMHQVKLSPYCIDRTEVTVGDYLKCMREARSGLTCKAPVKEESCNWVQPEHERHPINCVSWAQAEEYCRWAGRALPTEAQWEYAARGSDKRAYPWGSDTPSRICWNGEGNERGKHARLGTCAVGTMPEDKSQFGVLDMAGNVCEWVADWHAPYPTGEGVVSEDPKGPDTSPSGTRVIRGGSWLDNNAQWMRVTFRQSGQAPDQSVGIGFRCAQKQLR